MKLSISIRFGQLSYDSIHVIRRVEGAFEQLSGGDQIIGDNLSNVSACNKLVDDSELKDGRIPQVLGISIGLWLVSGK